MLRVVGGEIHQGEIRFVRNDAIYFKTSSGSVVKISMATLNPAGKRIVNSWISERGGSREYASWIGVTNQSFSKSWPRTVYGPTSIQLKKVQSLSKKNLLIYESGHYRFLINTKVEPRVIQRFAVLFEATHKFVLALPINASGHYVDKDFKFPIYLFGDYESYHRAGGQQGSAGVYTPRNQSVLVPMPVLGLSWDGRKWEYKKGGSNRVLENFMTLPYARFAGGRDANKNYGVGLLLTYYFYHHDGDGDGAKIKQYIKAVQMGKSERDSQKFLLRNRSYFQLQEEFRKFCAKGGISLEFPRK